MGSERHEAAPAVLSATDLSEAADEAIRQGHLWATRLGAELVVCHVIPVPHRANPLFPQRNETDTLSAVDLEQCAAEIVRARVSELTGRPAEGFRLVIDVGRPDAGIIRAAMTSNSDLIVLGSRGDSGLDRILLGGVSERVVRYAHCSVLVARATSGSGCVLAATDLSDPSLPAVMLGASEARRRGARLVVLHNLDLWPLPVSSVAGALGSAGLSLDPGIVQEERLRATQHLTELLARHKIEATCTVTTGAPDAAIVHAADELRPELLVIGTRGRTGLARLALGSVAERVVETASCSVLVVRMESEG